MENYNFNENEIKLLSDFDFPNIPLIINNYVNDQTDTNKLKYKNLNEELKFYHKVAFYFQTD